MQIHHIKDFIRNSPIIGPIRVIRRNTSKIPYYGKGRWCPVCEKPSRKFASFYGIVPRKDAKCMHCGALERHRLLWLYFEKRTDLFNNKTKNMLHIAPEKCFENKLQKHLGDKYITADLKKSDVIVKMDITKIPCPDDSFDIICCSHILEHIQDDRQAISELFRVLKKNGWAILLVPITTDITFEDPSITDPDELLKMFGQKDHVRRYGYDYIDRLLGAGFKVTVTKASDLLNENEIRIMGLTNKVTGEIYYCTKQ